MPGSITHLKAAYLYIDGSSEEPSEFYLGSVSPDSVNLKGHAEKAIRWPAHLRDRDLNVWLSNAEAFWKQSRDTVVNLSFLKGYLFHIITDIVWDTYFEGELFELFDAVGIPTERRKAMRWAELDGYEEPQARLPWFTETVLPALSVAKPESVGTLKRDEVALWRDRIVYERVEKGGRSRFINEAFMNRFFNKVSETADSVFGI